MAKTISLITRGLKGTLGDLTFVKSKRYGKHARAKRGTYTEAVLNSRMEESKNRLITANMPAQLIFNAVREEHKDGTLWTRLLSIYRKQIKDGSVPDLHCLKGLECSKEFTLHLLLSDYRVDDSLTDATLHILFKPNHNPVWRKIKYINACRVSLYVLFADLANQQLEKQVVRGPVTKLSASLEPLQADITVPSFAKEYAILIMVEGCMEGKPVGLEHVNGMRVVKTGVV